MSPPSGESPELFATFRRAVLSKIRRDLVEERAAADSLRERIVPLVAEAVQSVRDEGRCGRAWLFGSFAWGNPHERSDIDLLVEGDDSEVAYRVGRACGRDVHALRFDEAPESLRQRCEAEGVAL